jgi:hypothetical protein
MESFEEKLIAENLSRDILEIAKRARSAVYGHVTIEYEKPGKLRTTAGLNETTSQLAQYLSL